MRDEGDGSGKNELLKEKGFTDGGWKLLQSMYYCHDVEEFYYQVVGFHFSSEFQIVVSTMSQESVEQTQIQQEDVNMCDTAATSGAGTSREEEAFPDFTEAFILMLPLKSREEAITWAHDTAAKCGFL
ncbi:hypothetical protein Scep_024090 [Stephania cephalantha]|uniref:Uncharacterized protein n=1 Tax=Stephania cephalantha TaxID=152367 RepID=A0AAP0EVW3_9MAGN